MEPPAEARSRTYSMTTASSTSASSRSRFAARCFITSCFENYGRAGHRVSTVCPESGAQPFCPWCRSGFAHRPQGPSYEVRGAGGPGAVQTDAFDWTVPMSGRIVAASGHLHGGAAEHVAVRTANEPACAPLLGTTV